MKTENVRTGSALGIEVGDFRLEELNETTFQNLYGLLLKYKLVVLREQPITNDLLMSLARSLGRAMKYPFSSGIKDYPEIIEIVKRPSQTVNFSGLWHGDSTYLEYPPDFTILTALEVPTHGGDTIFSNCAMAFSSLSGGMQKLLRGQNAIFTSDLHKIERAEWLNDDEIRLSAPPQKVLSAVHSAVIQHPETGNPAIYINEEHTSRFEGMTVSESRPILDYIRYHIAKPEFTLRLTWQPGTIALWDNRAVQHKAINDYHGQQRIMRRIIVAGKSSHPPT